MGWFYETNYNRAGNIDHITACIRQLCSVGPLCIEHLSTYGYFQRPMHRDGHQPYWDGYLQYLSNVMWIQSLDCIKLAQYQDSLLRLKK